MCKIFKKMSERLEEMVGKMCGFRRPNSKSIVELQKEYYENLIESLKEELRKCEECGDYERVESYSTLIILFKEDLKKLEEE